MDRGKAKELNEALARLDLSAVLKIYGIPVKDENGRYRTVSSILTDLSEVWEYTGGGLLNE